MNFEETKKKFIEKLREGTLHETFDVYENPNSIIVRTGSRGILQNKLTDQYQLSRNPNNETSVATFVRDYQMITSLMPWVIQISILKGDNEMRRTSVDGDGNAEYLVKNDGKWEKTTKKFHHPIYFGVKSHLDKTAHLFVKN
jgi:hypothetical protein